MQRSLRWALGVAGILVGATAFGACSLVIDDDPAHCRNNGGTVACGTGLICDQCIPSSLSPSQDACVAPGELSACALNTSGSSGGSTVGDETTTEFSGGTMTTTGLDGTTTGTTDQTGPMTTGEPCIDDGECGFPTEFCGDQGNCVTCAGVPSGRCEELFPEQPICSDSQCVQCTETDTSRCVDETPICNVDEQMCEACDEHADCGDAACNFFNGECLDDAVVYVGPGEKSTLGDAYNAIETEAKATIVIREPVSGGLDIDSGLRLGILSEGDDHLWNNPIGATPQLTVSGGGTVIVEGMRIADNPSTTVPGVNISSGSAWFDRTQIVSNDGGGVHTTDADAVVLRNCFIHAGNNDTGLLVDGTNSVEVLYSTIGVEFGAAQAVACIGGSGSGVTLRNSILMARTGSDEIACDGLTTEYNATEMNLGGTNTMIADVEASGGWELWFDEADTGNFHIAGAGLDVLMIGFAQWQEGDPAVDIDGDPRPNSAGDPDRAGADVP